MFESPVDQFASFLEQLPAQFYFLVCGSGLLLTLAIVWVGFIKPWRAKAKLQRREGSGTPAPMYAATEPDFLAADAAAAPAQSRTRDFDTGQLPDLDTLVSVESDDLEEARSPAEFVPDEPVQPATPPSSVSPQPVPAGKQRIQLNTGAIIEADEVVSILRDPRDGRLIVEYEHTGYRTLIDTPEIKQHFVQVMRELSEVVTGPDENPPEETPGDQPSAVEAPPVRETPPSPPTSAPPPPVTPDGAMPGDLPKFNIEESLNLEETGRLFKKARYEPAPVPEINIAASIEAYLQHKLRHAPEFSGREIHVRSAPDGGVNIQVDNTLYETVDEVADAQVRDFLAVTIQEWQDRQ
jgi:hypothetical protein